MFDPVAVTLVLLTLAIVWLIYEVRKTYVLVEPIANSTIVRTASSF